MDNLAVSMQGITKIFNGVKANDNVDFNLTERFNPWSVRRKWCRKDNTYEYPVWFISAGGR